MKSDHEKEVFEKNKKINDAENRIRQKEQSINQKEGSLDKQIKENEAIKENLNRQIELVNIKRTELEKHQEEHIRRLEKIAGLTAEEAKAQLVESLKHEAQTQALAFSRKLLMMPNKKQIKKPVRSLFKPFNVPQQNKPLKIPSLFSTLKVMK